MTTLVRYTGLSERTVRTCLDQLEAEGIIRPCDPYVGCADQACGPAAEGAGIWS
jgi:DNA-binding Lrp family transcriptional regulator